jgi:hypothetical protein
MLHLGRFGRVRATPRCVRLAVVCGKGIRGATHFLFAEEIQSSGSNLVRMDDFSLRVHGINQLLAVAEPPHRHVKPGRPGKKVVKGRPKYGDFSSVAFDSSLRFDPFQVAVLLIVPLAVCRNPHHIFIHSFHDDVPASLFEALLALFLLGWSAARNTALADKDSNVASSHIDGERIKVQGKVKALFWRPRSREQDIGWQR